MVSVLSAQRDRFRARASQLEEQLTQACPPMQAARLHQARPGHTGAASRPCPRCLLQSIPALLRVREHVQGASRQRCATRADGRAARRRAQSCRQRRRRPRLPRRTAWPWWSACSMCRAITAAARALGAGEARPGLLRWQALSHSRPAGLPLPPVVLGQVPCTGPDLPAGAPHVTRQRPAC